MLKKSYYFLIILISLSCTSSFHYSYDYPLSSELIISKDSTLSAFLPKGWFPPNDNYQNPNYIFWLVKEDYNCAIILEKIYLDSVTSSKVQNQGLELIANISLELKKVSSKDFELSRTPVIFKMGEEHYCAYEYYPDWTSRKIRVIVFKLNGDYYECSAIPLSGVWYEKDLKELYSAAQTFVYSLTKFSSKLKIKA